VLWGLISPFGSLIPRLLCWGHAKAVPLWSMHPALLEELAGNASDHPPLEWQNASPQPPAPAPAPAVAL